MLLDRISGIGRLLNIFAATWMFLLAFVILADVVGRGLFNAPIEGTTEIIANSIVAITFAQLPYAVSSGTMLYTPILLDALPPSQRRVIEALGFLSGAVVFAILASTSFRPAIDALRTGEYFGINFKVPTFYTRAIIVAMSALCAAAYLALAWEALRGKQDRV